MDLGTSLTEFTTANGNQFPNCVRCQDEITSGHAYELGDDRWHTHCFSCYRCEKPLSCDSDFLVLGTGTLICFDCSDACRSCGKKIDDLAIILSSSNEAYCSECFKCCKCSSKIRDLRYAKTRKGLFCISCHEKLLAKRKCYEERKRRLRKDLPELPPELSTPPSIPVKSPRRPQYDLPQRSMKSNSESVISQYLDDIDSKVSGDPNEDSNPIETRDSRASTQESLGSEREKVEAAKENQQDGVAAPATKGKNRHHRQVSIDDILNSTLEEPDAFGLRNSIGGLSKTPLRNQDSSEHLAKSPVRFRHGMVVNDDDDDDHEDDDDDDDDDDDQDMEEGLGQVKQRKQFQLIPDLSNDDISELTEEEEKKPLENKGLALNLPSQKKDEDTLTLGLDDVPASPPSKIKAPQSSWSETKAIPEIKSTPEKKSPPENKLTSPQPKTSVSRHTPTVKSSPRYSPKPSSSSSSIKHAHSPRQPPSSISSISTPGNPSSASTASTLQGSSTGGNNLAPNFLIAEEKSKGGGSKLGRSLSMKSKHLVHNLKSRTTGILDPKPIPSSPPSHNREKLGFSAFPSSPSNYSISDATTKAESDTHTGWGVTNEKASIPRSPSMHRTTPKGKSDSNVHSGSVSPNINHNRSTSGAELPDHRRARSHASVSSSTATNVSMYRTPPLENNPVFGKLTNSSAKSHHRNFSWQAANEVVKEEDSSASQEADITNNSESSENEHFLKKELAEAELSLRRVKLELRELESKKRHLTSDVDHLKTTKEGLTRDIEGLKSEKERYILESLGQLQHQQQREQREPHHPQREQSQREQTQREQTQREQPQREQPQREQPQREQPQNHSQQSNSTVPQQQHRQQSQQHLQTPSLTNSGLSGNKQDISIDDISPPRQADTASIARPASKPRFWKIFSGGGKQAATPTHTPQHQNYSSQPAANSSTGAASIHNGGSNNNSKLEISNPVLQNPHEFSDMKLFPITNSNSESSSRTSPSRSDGSMLYGSNLVSRCAYEQNDIPMIVTVCVSHIESNENYMKAEGIYRKSGSQLLIEDIEKAFADCYAKPSPEVLKLMSEDIHAVASVLKRYLRKLPNPVLTFQIYEPLIKLVREHRLLNTLPLKSGGNTDKNPLYLNALESVTKILKNLPREHYDLLRYLSRHISKITSYSEWNLMNLYNLSLVFAPGLIRDYNGDKDILDMKERNYIVGFLLGNYKDIFD
ncbi:ZYRO0G04444p [Zygosaccharomyces rouxii]|uniref:ZYRO0G04444p n=1 Tax=Zygosaccharomyces rouxii (strain ATCC 2623 / CBS 732 / NBRC 1130 / NCYC 568 / NRRL Y-229) TaxID=559307 RepID=C5DZH4_ZYGRC|nr:uncharacterized protein ZYRO0G04444g [Zygosaccharomyces rouxii]KAH9202257.1 RhoGAP domain-containing protein [Zygosaccharomyces rouxii]CAR29258.1 ZYRO0G04444p [Zygosaccharomyces rouxii]